MFQIVYISYSANKFDPNGTEGIDSILEVARQYNQTKAVTGMLLYKGGIFLQILEGERAEIERLYGKIALDLRHEGLKILVKQDISERIFNDWSMAYKKIDEPDLNIINTILPWKSIVDDTQNRKAIAGDKILQIFKEFRYHIN